MELNEKIQKIIESKQALPIQKKDVELFETLVKNQYGYLNEQTLTGDMALLGQILVPVFRRAFPMLIGKDVCGVQPLSQPTGYAFGLRYHFANSVTGGNVIGGTDAVKKSSTANSILLILASATHSLVVGGTTSLGDTVKYVEGANVLVKLDSTGSARADYTVGGSEGGTTISAIVNNEAGYVYILKNYSGSYSTSAGEVMADDIRELGLTIDKIPVEAKTRKLRARYTIESAQDLKAIHGKDMAQELIDILTYEISQAIDRDIIDTINSAAVPSSFSAKASYTGAYGTNDGRWSAEAYRNVYHELIRKSNDIAKSTLRGPGNFIIASSDVCTMLETLPGWKLFFDLNGDVNTNATVNQTGQALIGSIGGRFKVYRDIFATENYATVGYKGQSSYDAGVIWSPYVPLQMKQTADVANGNPNIIFMERSAITANIFATDNFYRKVLIHDLFGVA
jgi:hypothetical protein